MARIYLPNGSYFTELMVNPRNWKTNKASIRKYWHITYYYVNPQLKINKLIMIRGMNKGLIPFRNDRSSQNEFLTTNVTN